MMTTATHNAYDTITERVLFVALELREKAGSVALRQRQGIRRQGVRELAQLGVWRILSERNSERT